MPRVGQLGGLAMPSAPTLQKIYGDSTHANILSEIGGVTTDAITFVQRYDVTASGVGQHLYHPLPPVGWSILSGIWTAYGYIGSCGNDLFGASGGLVLNIDALGIAYCTAIITVVKL